LQPEGPTTQQGLSHIDNADRNRRVLLNTIREKGPLSRVALSRECSLSIATTKRLVDELISQGMAEEGDAVGERKGRGRKPSILRLGSSFGYAVGVEVEPDAVSVSGLSFSGEVIYSRETYPPTGDRNQIEGLLLEEIRAAIGDCSAADRGPLLGVGVGIAGLVNAREGLVLYSPGLPGWENVPLAASLRGHLATEVIVDDGVRCMALAEKRHGSARDLDTFLFIYLGLGVGSGIILDNRIYRGKNGVAGEFGHITVKENGPLCTCGNRGCLETLASKNAVLARARELLAANVYSTLRESAGPLQLADLYAAALAGDKLAGMVIAETEESIGIGIADLINIFDPGTVILAGDVVSNLHELILDGIKRIVRRRAMHSIAQRTEIRRSAFDANSAALGAATMAVERMLENEILNL
jgi:predicted NBD/HSP70 family sugar kinase